jgi:hypothetical protein
MHKFVVTHKPIKWNIPFEHQLVTVNGYKQEGAIDASDFIGHLNLDRTFAIYGGIAAILENIKDLPDDDHIVVSGYRCYFGNTLHNNVEVSISENIENTQDAEFKFRELITPDELQATWKDKVLLEFPKEYELVISRPLNFLQSILEQHSTTHHFDDLLFGLAEAVRAGLLNPHLTANFLSQPIYISQFASKVSFFKNLYERIWWLCKKIYTKHHVPRNGYQERSINFTVERIISIYLMQKVYVERVPTVCAHLLHIDPNAVYQPSP